MFDTLSYRVDAGIATILLNRPERRNAINHQMHLELPRLWEAFNADADAIVAVLSGAGDDALCTGADLSDLPRVEGPEALAGLRWTSLQNGVWKPVICAVNGLAMGGGLHFVADSDIVLASDRARFCDTHVSVGLVAGFEPISLARKMPLDAVLRMALLGRHETLDAARALQLGMIGEVTPQESLMDRAMELARAITQNSPTAMARTKRAIWRSLDVPLDEALLHASVLIDKHNKESDFSEGVSAFRERRRPNWAPYSGDVDCG